MEERHAAADIHGAGRENGHLRKDGRQTDGGDAVFHCQDKYNVENDVQDA